MKPTDALAYYLDHFTLPPQPAKHLPTFASGDCLFREGDPADTFYLLYRGKIRLVKRQGSGSFHATLTLSPGSSLGLPAVLSGGPYTASAIALSRGRVYPVKQDTLQQFLEQYPYYHRPLAEQLARTLQHYEAITHRP